MRRSRRIAAPRFLITRAFAIVLGAAILARGLVAAREAASQEPTRMETHDDLLVRVETGAPGFGGMFIDADGRLAVYLIDTAQLPAARAAIEAVFGSSVVPPAGMRPIVGQYTVSQLATWTQQAASVLELPGVTFVDLDEARNRIAIGIAERSSTQTVQEVLQSVEVPRAAVVIDVTGAIRPVERRSVVPGRLTAWRHFLEK